MGAGLAAALAAAAGLLAGRLDGPWGMLPGGRFRAADQPCPAASAWAPWAGVPELQLEVRPTRPRSLTTWGLVHEGGLYVPADFLTPWKRWPHQVLADDRVRVRVEGDVFACRARQVADAARIEALRRGTAEKYGLAPDGRAARTEVWWFRILPR